jgi:hypothetical protein
MAKVIYRDASEDDPIYKEGFHASSTDKNTMNSSNLTKEEKRAETNKVLKELLQVTPPMASDASESTTDFVVPSHLTHLVARMKRRFPNASEEDLVEELKYS